MAPVTVITGGGRGIGAATARRLAATGHHVALCYRRDEAAATTVLADLRAAGAQAIAVRANTTDPEQVRALFDAAAQLGPLTGLVNNAGVTSLIGPFTELRVEDLRRVVDVNL
ncbi:SDR family NAD(P)-dependent oxidoreductase, partial [Micromonospora sp. NPDC048843]|uniref:SDR family NAD(P)-dependent oxidoreductase n=1 Tax=Micromonospora sp. NPDC048843 TaxID=3155389 RepID=UPI0033EA1CCD